MPRIPLIDPAELSPEAAESYQMHPIDLKLILPHAKTVYPGYRVMTEAVFAKLAIPPQERELIILATLHLQHGEYPWLQHVQIALDIGISQEKIDAISNDRFSAKVFSGREKSLLSFTRQVVQTVRVDDVIFQAVAGFYDTRQLVESIFLVGHYLILARMAEIAELEVDGVKGAELVRAAVAIHTPQG